MKRNPLLDSIPKRVYDQSASTLDEIMDDRCLNREQATQIRDLNLQSGAWEQVWKKVKGKTIKAYRQTHKR